PITANCMSPGPTRTDAGRGQGGWLRVMRLLLHTPIAGSPERAAKMLAWMAAAPELAGVTGRYFFRERQGRAQPITYDRAVAARLWSESERLTGLSPDALRAGGGSSVPSSPAAPDPDKTPWLGPLPHEVPSS